MSPLATPTAQQSVANIFYSSPWSGGWEGWERQEAEDQGAANCKLERTPISLGLENGMGGGGFRLKEVRGRQPVQLARGRGAGQAWAMAQIHLHPPVAPRGPGGRPGRMGACSRRGWMPCLAQRGFHAQDLGLAEEQESGARSGKQPQLGEPWAKEPPERAAHTPPREQGLSAPCPQEGLWTWG